MSRVRLRTFVGIAGLAAAAAGAAALLLLRRPAVQIERLTDHPQRLRFSGAAQRAQASTTPLRWTAADIAHEWRNVGGTGPALLRSPALDLAGGIDSIAIALAPAAGRGRLLWSARESPTAGDRARNVHELHPRADHPVLTALRGERITEVPFPEHRPEAARYLFLEGDIQSLVRSVQVVRVQDRMREAAGPLRVNVSGEIRDALPTPVPGEVAYTTVLPRDAELVMGLSAREAAATVTVQVASGRRSRLVFTRALAPGEGWTDVRVPLPGHGPATLTLRAQGPEGGTVLWGSPMIVPRTQPAGPPSVIVYLMDALRPDHLGFQGYARPTSPFMDALARRSLVFRRCYAGGAWTKPSVATLLTSLHPQTHGVGARSYGDALPDDVPTLQGVLRRHGYVTALFSANPLGGTASNLDHGFDQAFSPGAFPAAAGGKVRADDLHRPLLRWIEAHADERFFAFVHAVDTHPPFAPADGGEAAAYDAAIASADAALRALYERLEAMGLASRTLLVVTADHGRALGERGQTGHGLSVREDQVRVPLLVHEPGRVSPGVVEDPVHLVDVLPTVLARCGLAAPTGAQGEDLVRAAPPARPVFVSRFVFPEASAPHTAQGPEQLAVVEHSWKMIVTAGDPAGTAARAELFDLSADPQEGHDLSARERERVRRMSRELRAFLLRQAAARAAFRKAHGESTVAASPELLEQLRALGYAR